MAGRGLVELLRNRLSSLESNTDLAACTRPFQARVTAAWADSWQHDVQAAATFLMDSGCGRFSAGAKNASAGADQRKRGWVSNAVGEAAGPNRRGVCSKRAVTLLCGAAGAVKKCRRLMLKNVSKDKVLAGVLLF